MKNYYIDLKKYFNTRMIFPKETARSDEDGFIHEDNFIFGIVDKEGIAFSLERNAAKNDCIECSNQEVLLNNKKRKVKKIMVAGLSVWGIYKEKIKVVYDDSSYEFVQVHFFDWAFDAESLKKYLLDAEWQEIKNSTNVFYEGKRKDGNATIYYSEGILSAKNKKICKIILPDNILMHIFAITLVCEEDKNVD